MSETKTQAAAAQPTGPDVLVPRSRRALLLGALAVIALTALDLGSKTWAEGALSEPRRGDRPAVCEPGPDGWSDYQRMRGDAIPLIDDVLEFEYAENCGAAFSLLHDAPHGLRTGIFSLAALAAIIVLSVMFAQGRGGPWLAAGVPMVVSGALGNLVDRVRYGYVVDFIHFHWHDSFDYPVFNVADIGVVVGVILLVIDGWRTPEPLARTAAVETSALAKNDAPDEAQVDEEEEDDEEAEEATPESTTESTAESASEDVVGEPEKA